MLVEEAQVSPSISSLLPVVMIASAVMNNSLFWKPIIGFVEIRNLIPSFSLNLNP